MQKSLRSAFSLTEIAIVLLIISTILVGIIKTNDIIIKSRLSTAQTLTQNSPVRDIANLALWYETSLKSSFIDSEIVDNGEISTWYDNNPNASSRKNATQSTSTSQPLLVEKVFNETLSAIRFDGNDDFMSFDASSLINSSYTIFAIEQRRSEKPSNYFLGGTASILGEEMHMGYKINSSIEISHQGSENIEYAISAYTTPTPTMHTASFNMANGIGKKYWINGGDSTDASSTTQLTPLSSFIDASLGLSNNSYYNGDIAEIIIFNRCLKTEEIQLVQDYLRKKYHITLS